MEPDKEPSEVCKHCGHSSERTEVDVDTQPREGDTDGEMTLVELRNKSKTVYNEKHLLVHGESRLGRLFDKQIQGKQLTPRVMLRQFVSDRIAAIEEAVGARLYVDLDDWPRDHERAADVRRALAVLEPALHISVAIDPNKLVGLNIRLYPARYMFYIQGVVSFQHWDGMGQLLTEPGDGGLSDNGVLHVRGNPEDVRRAFCHLDVEVAAERREAIMEMGHMAGQLRQALCSLLRVRFVVHDDNKLAESTAKQFVLFVTRMLQSPALWAPLAYQPTLALVVRVYNNDRWLRVMGTPPVALVDTRILDVRHNCRPVELLAALVVIHRRIQEDEKAARQHGLTAFEGEDAEAWEAERLARKRQQQSGKQAAAEQQSASGKQAAAPAVAAGVSVPIPSWIAGVLRKCLASPPAEAPYNPDKGLGILLQAWSAVRAGPAHAMHMTCRAGMSLASYHNIVRGQSGVWVA